MTFGERLRSYRLAQGLSQEQAAQQLGISRQAVAKWEYGQSAPSTENLVALSKLYQVSLDELAGKEPKGKAGNPILRSNLTLLAIICHAAAWNVCVQPLSDNSVGAAPLLLWKLIPLLAASIWMACNLRWETDPAQRRKNARIELFYCLLQAAAGIWAYSSHQYFPGALLILALALGYVFWINPRFMNRQLVRKKA